MLISKTQYNTGDIVSFKLTNGDECVARIITADAAGWTVSKPCTVVPGQRGLGLVQSLFTGELDAKVSLSVNHVLMHSPTIKEMCSHYIKTTTGIETVPSGLVV